MDGHLNFKRKKKTNPPIDFLIVSAAQLAVVGATTIF